MAGKNEMLERALLLQKAKQIQAQKMGSSQYGQPGVNGVGVTDGQTPAATLEDDDGVSASGLAIGGLKSAVKGMDMLRGGITAPAIAAALGAITGKDVYRPMEHINAISPIKLDNKLSPHLSADTYPGMDEIYDRAGIPKGGSISDVFPAIYTEPSEDNHFWQLEKGGMLDPTVRGAGGLASDITIDPLSWFSFGAAGAAKEAAKQSASRMVLEQAAKKGGLSEKLLGLLNKTGVGQTAVAATQGTGRILGELGQAMDQGVNKLPGMTTARKGLDAVATAPSKLLGKIGEKAYNSAFLPAEHEGIKYGKKEIADAFYKAHIATPFNLTGKGEDAVKTLMEARNAILEDARAAGAEMDMHTATKYAQEFLDNAKYIDNPKQEAARQFMQDDINTYKARQGKAAVPYQPEIRASKLEKDFHELPVPQHQPPIDPNSRVLREKNFELQPENQHNWYEAPTEGMQYDVSNARPGEGPQITNVGKADPKKVYAPENPFPMYKTGAEPAGEATRIINNPIDTVEHSSLPVGGEHSEKIYRPAPYELGLENREYVVHPERPAQPRVKGPDPVQGSSWKTSEGDNIGRSGYDQFKKSSEGQRFAKAEQRGLKEEVENSVGRSLGPEKAGDVADINNEAGKFLTTQRSQFGIEKQADREFMPNRTHGILGGVGGLSSLAIRTLIDGARVGATPLAYGARRLSDGRLSAPIIDILTRSKLKQMVQPQPQEEE